jgi:hypothetical protein
MFLVMMFFLLAGQKKLPDRSEVPSGPRQISAGTNPRKKLALRSKTQIAAIGREGPRPRKMARCVALSRAK